jgi:hypothetical protein
MPIVERHPTLMRLVVDESQMLDKLGMTRRVGGRM